MAAGTVPSPLSLPSKWGGIKGEVVEAQREHGHRGRVIAVAVTEVIPVVEVQVVVVRIQIKRIAVAPKNMSASVQFTVALTP